jgi:NAD(P)-dependent dehydrogenase (short-subunit alcohol dehydrogenase family)
MNIVITGGSRGIGKETAINLAADRNNHLLVTGTNEGALRKLENDAPFKNISFYVFDFSSTGISYSTFADHVSSLFSNIDVLINNAGSLINKKFTELDDSEVRKMMEVNYFAPVTLIRSLFPLFREGSHIINMSSMGGFQGSVKFNGLSCYSASKAALACLTECLASEFREYGISVNCIAPGSVSTEMLSEAFPGYKAPLSAREMGNFISWFVREGGKFFNGKILPVAISTP